jgi:hypothetical protein
MPVEMNPVGVLKYYQETMTLAPSSGRMKDSDRRIPFIRNLPWEELDRIFASSVEFLS